ncbi:MAG TPA: hypothetical protein PLJ37_11500 [Chitinophagales bacterium]|nr:hypothetical protein [Chitinophagales bacterium]HMZ69504.1 hypothetical protein [Chitinophagales bacterium]HMZ95358.1 hypothetical protein [Chitinophagales bacterium]HNC64438.1 hypothetical protein [Chitinophagales bacterium]HNE87315.1 hypothetical protein [Chitinophagales bacterium]
MTAIIYIVSFLVVMSKFLDCYTTSSQITSVEQERNPLARKIMNRYGIHTTIWGIFGLTIIIVGISIWLLFNFYNTTLYKVFYIVLGLIVALTQFAVAHTNKTKRLNIFTRFLLTKMYKRG